MASNGEFIYRFNWFPVYRHTVEAAHLTILQFRNLSIALLFANDEILMALILALRLQNALKYKIKYAK